ncbi:N-acetyltransferase [Alkalibacterium olivapovliticus]|uniref:Riboflavin biosynthesis RibT protein n=1 Tax=Alkalibacterium olivapovliticus TaxID=99907 RepID=A0A2T0W0Y9_9LACT|nr:N-acetyltransferase [Alkalibacterium olivapovliticus]PRY78429.1 riboflavin biosynthesis RibT protein [Alkalibacterium olivapovliticus]
MLVKYKADYQKISMGLLSYVPDLKDTSRLTKEMQWYEQEENRQLYLWKSQETGDFVGVVGVEEDDEIILLRHIALNPSYREEGMSFSILTALSNKCLPKKIVGTLETASLVTKWQKESDKSE